MFDFVRFGAASFFGYEIRIPEYHTAHLFCRQLGSDHGAGDDNAMLSRESVPLHDEIPVFAELAAIRVSNESLRSKECS